MWDSKNKYMYVWMWLCSNKPIRASKVRAVFVQLVKMRTEKLSIDLDKLLVGILASSFGYCSAVISLPHVRHIHT